MKKDPFPHIYSYEQIVKCARSFAVDGIWVGRTDLYNKEVGVDILIMFINAYIEHRRNVLQRSTSFSDIGIIISHIDNGVEALPKVIEFMRRNFIRYFYHKGKIQDVADTFYKITDKENNIKSIW